MTHTHSMRVGRGALIKRRISPVGAIIMAVAIVVSSFAGATVVAGTAGANQTYFHLHVDSYTESYNCADWEWTTGSYGQCTAKPGLRGFPNPLLTDVTLVRWCTAATNCTKVGNTDLALPSGYSRWMVFCPVAGPHCDTYNWLLGAVRTPNGPFTVMEGEYNGHPVKPSGTGAVESQGGPLFLYIGYWGRVGLRTGQANGYVFGLRGHLDIPSCNRNPCPAVGL
jgi:hypothetical protein